MDLSAPAWVLFAARRASELGARTNVPRPGRRAGGRGGSRGAAKRDVRQPVGNNHSYCHIAAPAAAGAADAAVGHDRRAPAPQAPQLGRTSRP
jgi:hypothetical protein